MLLDYDSTCPAFKEHAVGTQGYDPSVGLMYHCDHCKGCKGIFSNGIDCGYSKTPIGAPKFHEGEYVYRNGFIKGEKMLVVIVKWDGRFEWEYALRSIYSSRREQHFTSESDLFATQEEANRRAIEESARQLLAEVQRYEKRFGKPIGGFEIKMLEGQKFH